MNPPLEYELRLGVLGPAGPADDGQIAAWGRAAEAAGLWLMRRLRDRPHTTRVRWVVVRSANSPICESIAKGLSVLGDVREEWVQAEAAAAGQAFESVADASEILLAARPEHESRQDPLVESAVRHALRSGRKVIGLDGAATAAQLRWLALKTGHAAAGGAHIVAAELPLRRPEVSMGFVRVSAFNRECRFEDQPWRASVLQYQHELRASAEASGIAAALTAPIMQDIVPLLAKADQVAQRYQLRHRWAISAMHCLAAAAVSAATIQAVLAPTAHWIAALELVGLLAALLVLRIAARGFWHERWLYSRYLAEQLRVAAYMLIAALDATSDFKTQSQRPLNWGADQWLSSSVQRVIQAVGARLFERSGAELPPLASRKRFVIDGLIRPQEKWQRRTAHRKHARVIRLKRFTAFLFFAAALLAAMHLLHVGSPHPADHIHHATSAPAARVETPLEHAQPAADDAGAIHGIRESPLPAEGPAWQRPDLWITLLAILIPIWAGVLHGIARHFDDERGARRSEQIGFALASLADRAERCVEEASFATTCRETSRVMAAEIQDWLVELSFRPPELVV